MTELEKAAEEAVISMFPAYVSKNYPLRNEKIKYFSKLFTSGAQWQKEQKPQGRTLLEVWKDMRFEVYQQASGNRHEPNYSDDNTKMFSLTDIDEIFEKVAEKQGEQKPAWSEEDETNLNEAIYFIRREPYRECDVEPIVDWLRTLKERMKGE